MNFVCILLLIGWSAAARCDKYVTGQVWIHKMITDETATPGYEGCKKGCFDNNTYKDDGTKKCEKCSIIEEEKLCLQNAGTCQWKSGKCVSQSCPQMAKETNTYHASYKECVEGSPKEQAFNSEYWSDYKTNYNTPPPNFPGNNPDLDNYINQPRCQDKISPGNCRLLWETEKNICYFREQEQWQSGSLQKNRKESCLTENYNLLSGASFPSGGGTFAETNTPNQTLFKLTYGFSTAEEVCNDEISRWLKNCDDTYNNQILSCYNTYYQGRTSTNLNHIRTKEARTKCHLVYGCMYSKDNERCSVWAVWAFVLALVLSIVVVVAVIIVVVIVLIPKRKKVESA